MPRLEDLRKAVTQMTDAELQDHFRRIREDRKVRKETAKIRKTRVQTGSKARTQLESLLKDMTPKQKAELLQELEG